MAVPVAPTVTSILTEAFKRCGVPVPTQAQLLRAEDEWLGEVLTELQNDKRWHALEETMVVIPEAYVQIIDIPPPLTRVLRMRFYDGDLKGTAQSGGASSITVAAGTGTDGALGRKIYLTGGTGLAQNNRLISRVGDTYGTVATWDTNPDLTTQYMIANLEYEVNGPQPMVQTLGVGPTNLISYWEEFEGKLRLYPVPNKGTFALEIDGIVDLLLVDETDARLVRVLREWRNPILHGIMTRIKEDQQDDDIAYHDAKYSAFKHEKMMSDSRQRRRLFGTTSPGPGGLPRRRPQ